MIKRQVDCIVFIFRQSPDWALLAHDYETKLPIDPSRYIPNRFLTGFPENIDSCIQTWNEVFQVNFFRCRQIMKGIAIGLLKQINHTIIISENEAASLPRLVGDRNFILFFLDDDDWFAPDTFEKLTTLDIRQDEIAVFPLARFNTNADTFVRQFESARTIIGTRKNFDFRYQTNNYGIGRDIALTNDLLEYKDHVEASHFADASNVKDRYFDVLISATNKTPCSASKLGSLVTDAQLYKTSIDEYIKSLESLPIPAELSWCNPALHAMIELFSSVTKTDK